MSKTNEFTLATLNTCGVPSKSYSPTRRYPAIGQAFEQLSPDVINLQEVWFYNLLGLMKKRLPSYPYVIYRSGLFGPLAGLVTFSRLPLRTVSFFEISSPAAPGRKGIFNRIKQPFIKRGVLVSRLAERSLLIGNTHLMANMDDDWSKRNRHYPAHHHDMLQFAELVHDLKRREPHLLISGDFNVPKCSDLYSLFVERAQVSDVFGADDSPTYRAEFLRPGDTAHCIDYIFSHSDILQSQNQSRLFEGRMGLADGSSEYLSDHIGLLAGFSFADKALGESIP